MSDTKVYEPTSLKYEPPPYQVTWYDPNKKGKSPVQQAVAGRSAAIDARAR
jgi:hypothetical protein